MNKNIDVNITHIFINNYFLMKFKIIKYFNQIQSIFYKSPLILAVEKENIEIVKCLLSKTDLNINYKMMIEHAIENYAF